MVCIQELSPLDETDRLLKFTTELVDGIMGRTIVLAGNNGAQSLDSEAAGSLVDLLPSMLVERS